MDKNSTLPVGVSTEQTPDPEKHTPRQSMRIGTTTFLVGIHFNPDAKENINDKVKRMILNDVKQGKVV